MGVPCIADLDDMLTNIDFLRADIEDLKAGYTADCVPESLERLHESRCRTAGVAGQLCFLIEVDVAAYPMTRFTSLFFPLGDCG